MHVILLLIPRPTRFSKSNSKLDRDFQNIIVMKAAMLADFEIM